MQTIVSVVLCIGLLIAIERYLEFRKAIRSVHNHPGFRTVLSHIGISNLFPRIPGITIGGNTFRRHADFEMYGSDIITVVAALPSPRVDFMVADADAIKEITGSRARFPKPVELYTLLLFFGGNIVASEHDEWKRYRKISAPAFTEPNNKLVWDETVRVMLDLFNNVWGDKQEIATDHALEIFMPITLFVIGAAGFGRRISWNDELVAPPGHQMAFKDALHTVSSDVLLKLLVPSWAMGLTKRFRKVKLAFDELENYMLEMIQNRRTAEKKEERYDLLSSLLDANEGDSFDEETKLADRELLGNIFIFLLAGHETTAHTLCFAFALLAMYPDEQEKLYQDIKRALPDGRLPTYEDINALTYADCVLNEALRMFPPVNNIPKYSAEDTTLVTSNMAGEKITVPIPKGASINIHTPGLHYNPRYWDDPNTFKPSRFLGDWPRDAFLPFSGGVRSCLGRRFAELESIVALTLLTSRYKVEIKPEPQFAGETFEQRKERVFASKPGLTLTPIRVPLVFKRR